MPSKDIVSERESKKRKQKKKTYRGLRCVPSQAPADAVVDVDVDVAANTF